MKSFKALLFVAAFVSVYLARWRMSQLDWFWVSVVMTLSGIDFGIELGAEEEARLRAVTRHYGE